ncbi:MAG: chemotaxis protein CheW [Pseudoxanthomonas sp.]
MARSEDELRGVLVQTGQERVLLPNATVAEVLARVPVEPVADAPAWLPGTIDWHGWRVPLVSLPNLGGGEHEQVLAGSKMVVLKTLTGGESMPYMALLTQSFPRLVSVPRDGLLADASEEALPAGVQMRVLLGEESAMLPDLEAIEAQVAQALA